MFLTKKNFKQKTLKSNRNYSIIKYLSTSADVGIHGIGGG